MNIKPFGNNVLVRMAPPPKSDSLIITPDTAEVHFATGPAFPFSKKGALANVLAIGPDCSEVYTGALVLVDKLCGEPIAELDGDAQDRELRMVREHAIVAIIGNSP